MEWRDEGIILGSRSHGETSVIAEVLTAQHGRCLGLVRGGRSRRLRPVLQPGNIVQVEWYARLEEHLGSYQVEPLELQAGLVLENSFRLAGLSVLTALARVLPEREPHPRLYAASRVVLEAIGDDDVWPALLVRWEMGLLDELGFGLDLAKCAATGSTVDLTYVSPKSGKAVSYAAGLPYDARLFKLPFFLIGGGAPAKDDVVQGLRLTGHFLERHVFAPRAIEMPSSRQWLVDALEQRMQ